MQRLPELLRRGWWWGRRTGVWPGQPNTLHGCQLIRGNLALILLEILLLASQGHPCLCPAITSQPSASAFLANYSQWTLTLLAGSLICMERTYGPSSDAAEPAGMRPTGFAGYQSRVLQPDPKAVQGYKIATLSM